MNSHPYLVLTDQGDYENVIQRLKTKGVRITERLERQSLPI